MTQDWRYLKPAWSQLSAIGLLLLSLLALIAALVDASTGRTILELAVVALVCPWMVAWVWRACHYWAIFLTRQFFD